MLKSRQVPAVRRCNETVVWLALRALASSVPAVLGSGAATAACDTAAERHRERCERRSALCTSPSLPLPPSLSVGMAQAKGPVREIASLLGAQDGTLRSLPVASWAG